MIALLLLLAASATALPTSRIHNGNDAIKGAHPHQISLQSSGSHICGGSVIGDQWVITAAHCVTGSASSYTVVVNEHDRSEDYGDEIEYSVAEVIQHSSYGSGSGAYPNDIALLRVDGNIDDSNVINLVSTSMGNLAGDTGVISGWGRTEANVLPDILQYAEMPVLSQTDCRRTWGSNINDGHICVRDYTAAACNGDSGGPLVVDGRLAGVTSWGITGCGANHNYQYPSVYTRVSYFLGWIEGVSGITP